MLLNGKWTLEGVDEKGRQFSLPATVPGCVHTDLIENGIISDIYFRDNSKKVQWIEQNDFTYSRTFRIDSLENNAYLHFEGLDTYCEVFLNGQRVGSVDDMFIAYDFCVDGVLTAGENTLSVRFRSPVKEVEGREKLEGCFTTERLYTRRIQCTYGWDWVDRFVTMGIYRNVSLEFRKENEISSHYIYTKDINPLSAQLWLTVEIDNFCDNGEQLGIEILSPEGECLLSKKRTILSNKIYERIDIRNPQLWYPNGYGDQPLYTLKLSRGEKEKVSRFGIRKISIVELPDLPGSEYEKKAEKLKKCPHFGKMEQNEESSGFIVLVNDIKIMCKGANWVPCEPFPSAETPEKIKKLIELGALGGLNFLRVWGGGIFEQDAFYDECDRLGILVAQDFLMACGKYPESLPEFKEWIRKETVYAARLLRNHTCLAWWHGDNENAVEGNENIKNYPGYISAKEVMEPILRELDPNRIFLPSSPYGGMTFASAVRGTTHNSEFLGDLLRYFYNNDIESHTEVLGSFLDRFCSEQPTMGMPFISSLKKFLTDEDIYGEDMSMLEFHTKNNPGFGDITLHYYCTKMCERIFGGFKDGMERFHKLQMLQCEWIRQSFELFRRNKWFSAGIVFWMFNDCWPAANGWSIVDYYGDPKPAYYMFKRCAKPIVCSVERRENDFAVFVSNDSLVPISGNGRLYLYDYESKRDLYSADISVSVAANESSAVLSAKAEEIEKLMSDTTVLICDVLTDGGEDRTFYFPRCFRHQRFFEPNLRIVEESDEYITVTADEFSPISIFDTPYILEENCFPLKAGENRRIKILGKIQ